MSVQQGSGAEMASVDGRPQAAVGGFAGTGRALPRLLPVWAKAYVPAITAAMVFLGSLAYYAAHLFPGLGGELNAGDSAKFQVLGHASIMVHGPGYPLVLMLGAGLRALALPFAPWWSLTFSLSAVPGALANAIAFLIVLRLTGSALFGLAAALLLGSAGLMAVQATEAEVYALILAFILATLYLLIRFVETERIGVFLAACAVYAISFGNHLMMIMLLPVFFWLTVRHHRIVLRPAPVAIILGVVLLGASQYLYLAYIAYSPDTAYSEYMPLPPTPMELVDYILGSYFADLYGSGLASTQTLEALIGTLRSAHPWISLPMIVAGIVLFVGGWKQRDVGWYGLAVIYGTALCFTPFMLWYGAYDIEAFHLPVLGPLLVAAVATLGWHLKRHPALLTTAAAMLLLIGSLRAGQTATLLDERKPMLGGLKPAIEAMVAQAPVDRPIFAMTYGLRMATLYHALRGELPRSPIYRVRWRAIAEVREQPVVGGVVVPTDGYQFVHWIKARRPDMTCRTQRIELPAETRWPAYAFKCRSRPGTPLTTGVLKASACWPAEPPGTALRYGGARPAPSSPVRRDENGPPERRC